MTSQIEPIIIITNFGNMETPLLNFLLLILSAKFIVCFTVTYDVSKARDLDGFARRAKEQMEAWHGRLSYELRSPNYTPSDKNHIYFDPNYNGVAYCEYWISKITGSVDYYRRNPNDVGSMIHEMVHSIQYYKDAPSWVWEGMADYARYYIYTGEGNRKPQKPSRSNKWTDGYGVTAYFFNYVVQSVRSDMMYWVNKDAREGTYKDTIWPRLIGKNLEQLWNEMLANG